MRKALGWMAAGMLILLVPSASRSDDSLWDRYTKYWDRVIDEVVKLDLYGGSAQVPAGVFTMKYEWNGRTAAGRYDGHGHKTALIPPIDFGPANSPTMELDLGASGRGGGITMQFSYGITDMLNFYLEVPFQYMDVQMRPKLRKLDQTECPFIKGCNPQWFNNDPTSPDYGKTLDRYLNEASAWLLDLLPELGRPPMRDPGQYPQDLGPGKAYHSNGWVLGDINTGFSWNFYRDKRWSGAFTGRVYFPTGGLANPNGALTMGTGPEIDRGVGSFGVGLSQNYDIRIFKYKYWIDIVVGLEFDAAYHFKQYRRYPDFPKPTQAGNNLLDLIDKDRQIFPDMSDLTGKYYEYTPGASLGAMAGLSVGVLMFDFSVNFGYSYSQEVEFSADPRFETMVKTLQMTAEGHMEIMRIAAGINLFPLYIPLQIHYQYETSVGGRNSIYFTDNHWITVQGYIPTVF